jgi:sterol desaturase/sphingolipid hydroxylase (fatty acid hydroxylase superfamily)
MQVILSHLNGKAAVLLLVLLVVMIIERTLPFAPLLNRTPKVMRNLSFALVNVALSPLVVIPLSLVAANWAPQWRPHWMSGTGGLILDLLVLDVWIYWWHRANHKFPVLWRFHEVHHLDEHLDASTGLRFHFGEVCLSAIVRAIVVFVLSIPIWHLVVFETVVAFAAIFHHSNIRLPQSVEAFLSWIIVTPSIHWVHHHAVQRDTDSSYATVLSLWDRLFASQSPFVRTQQMQLGVENSSDESIQRLLVKPFLPRSGC